MSEAIEIYNGATFKVVSDDQNPSQSEIWATRREMAKAFGVTQENVRQHIKDILQSAELQEVETCKDFLQVQTEGEKQVTRQVKCYNLSMIIAVGFRVKSIVGTRFRQWANQVLRKYSTQGCVVDVNAMANGYKKSELFALLAEASKRCEEQEQKLLAQAKTIDEQGQTIDQQEHTIDEQGQRITAQGERIVHLDGQVNNYAAVAAMWAPYKAQPEGSFRRRGTWVRPRKSKQTPPPAKDDNDGEMNLF